MKELPEQLVAALKADLELQGYTVIDAFLHEPELIDMIRASMRRAGHDLGKHVRTGISDSPKPSGMHVVWCYTEDADDGPVAE